MSVEPVRNILICLSLILASGSALAQQPQAAPQGQNPEPVAQTEPAPQQAAPQEAAQAPASMPPVANPANQAPAYGLPAVLTVKPGTFLTMRVNQPLSSDRNRPGDTFSGTLAQPLVVDGVVVAQRGQMVYGMVEEAAKAHSDSPSRLGLALSEITLVDGTQVPVRSELAAFQGGRTPAGQQAGTVVGSTVAGTAVGAIAGQGTGAAVGAGIGALAGGVAVLLTRNRPTIIYPESALTFRMEAPLEISTARAPQAFQFVNPNDYNRPPTLESRAAPRRYGYPATPPPVYVAPYPYWGYPYYYPGYYGMGVGVYIGRGRRWR